MNQTFPRVVYKQLPQLCVVFKHLSTYAILCVDDHSRNVNYSSVFSKLTKQVGR